jgi:hypothetical protein
MLIYTAFRIAKARLVPFAGDVILGWNNSPIVVI